MSPPPPSHDLAWWRPVYLREWVVTGLVVGVCWAELSGELLLKVGLVGALITNLLLLHLLLGQPERPPGPR